MELPYSNTKTRPLKLPKRLNAEVTSRQLDDSIELYEDLMMVLSQRVTTMADQDIIKAMQIVAEQTRFLDAHLASIKAENPDLTCEDLGISVGTLEANFSGVD